MGAKHNMPDRPDGAPDGAPDSQRLDRWLWCARFFRTRSLASEAIKKGRVKIAGQRAKPAQSVSPGLEIEISRPPLQWSVVVLKLSPARVSAKNAASLYQESADSEQARELVQQQLARDRLQFSPAQRRPDKRERRRIIRFTRRSREAE